MTTYTVPCSSSCCPTVEFLEDGMLKLCDDYGGSLMLSPERLERYHNELCAPGFGETDPAHLTRTGAEGPLGTDQNVKLTRRELHELYLLYVQNKEQHSAPAAV